MTKNDALSRHERLSLLNVLQGLGQKLLSQSIMSSRETSQASGREPKDSATSLFRRKVMNFTPS